jgi:chaperonin GroEL
MKLRDKTNIEICEENDIQYTFLTNVVEEKNTKAKIRATLQIISKILVGTLGPYGSTTIIQDREMNHFATKDGYDLMNKISFSEEVSRTILDMVRQVASNQVLTVGDGSTSAIVVSNALFSALTDPEIDLFSKASPKDILDILNDISEYLEVELKNITRPVSDDLKEIETVAMIATNNDAKTGRLIKEIYDKIGEYGFISTDIMEKREKDEYEIKQGIEWERGYIDEYFSKGYENKRIIHATEPRVFLTNSVMTYEDFASILAPMIGQVCGKESAELIIIANDYDDDVRHHFKINRTQHLGASKRPELKFTAVDIEQITDSGKYSLEDLAVLLDCEIYDKYKNKPAEIIAKPERFIGKAEKIIITKKNTQVIGKDLSEEHKERKAQKVSELKEKLQKALEVPNPTQNDEFDKYIYRRRLSALTDSTAVIHVAGKSFTERMTRERLLEDAILASKSAIKHGVIPGGNIMIPKIIYKDLKLVDMLEEKYHYIPVEDLRKFLNIFMTVFMNAFLESYTNVLNNSYFNEEQVKEVLQKCLDEDKFYNLKSHQYEDLSTTQVINSVDTDIQILRSVISIIGIIATSNQMITLNLSASDQIKK